MDYYQIIKSKDEECSEYLGYNQYNQYNKYNHTQYDKREPEYNFEQEYEYLPEYHQENKKVQHPRTFLNFKKRPANSLEYMKFQSEDYLRYKIENKVKDRIKELNLGNKIETQIFEVCFNFYKKFKEKPSEEEKIRLCDLIPIVAYKIIKCNRITISHKDAIEKLNLDKSKFLKFSNQIPIGDENLVYKFESGVDLKKNIANENDIKEKINEFLNKVNEYVQFIIQKLSEFYKIQPDALKIKNNERLIDFYFTKFEKIENVYSEGKFFDNLKFLEEVKKEASLFIYAKESPEKFSQLYDFFNKKILIEHLASALVKKLSDMKGIKINLHTFRDVFNIPISGISRGIKILNEYFRITNKERRGG
jgi:hypothetical protein